ncbi:hypothetical protein LUZ60_004436 [Juncus effusus]|nr:hypothetical protein LUZ60_004436 [Juncus effusus]
MSCIQTTTYKPSLGPLVRTPRKRQGPICASFSPINPQKSRNYNHARLLYIAPRYRNLAPINSLSGSNPASNNDDAFSMESLKRAMEGMKKEKPLRDSLLEKMQLDFGGNIGGGANRRPPGGSGGSGGSNEFNFGDYLDEAFQVFMATLGLVSVYIYVIRGEELLLLARDYLKYLIWGRKTMRLRRAIGKFNDFKFSVARKFIRNPRIGVRRGGTEYYELAMREVEQKGVDGVEFDENGMVLVKDGKRKSNGDESDYESDDED